jgi:3',5'-cyclic AMP phosphodiesterase CpdA
MRIFFLFLIATTLLTTSAKADDVIFNFGQNFAAATTRSYIGGGTNLDAQPWKTLSYAESGWLLATPSALGFGASVPPKNTSVAENTTIGGGGIVGARYPTLYFRKIINISNPSAYINFLLKTKFDDAIAIWINGIEAFRNNISPNPSYATLATASIANSGADIYSATLNTSLFTSGNNIIAVEVHQSAATSSDLFFDMELVGVTTVSLTRGPYLQLGNENSVTVRWRTNIPTNSTITLGNSFGAYTNTIDSTTITTEHTVKISGLTADTKYYYTIGSSVLVLQAGADNYFVTMPLSNSNRKTNIWALGDCGNASANQIDTKNAFIGTSYVDALITLGDNAYSYGLDAEFQAEFFDIYKDDILKYYKLYPTPGNHDYGNSDANTAKRDNAYFSSFDLPTNGECGGLASGTEAYYSFDVGNVHLISLDSYGREDGNTTKLYDTLGAQTLWVKNDLAANTKRWVVVYFHHPPYTMTSHNSDAEAGDLGAMRENFIRILERYGVDVVLCGHSHGYERSYLLKNYYKATSSAPSLLEADFNSAIHTATKSNQNAMYNGTANACPYTYNSGQFNHGIVYVVSGSAGQLGGTQGAYPHNAMFYSNATNGGSFYIEADSNRLDAKFISYTGTGANVSPIVRDQFTIFKDVNKRQTINVLQNNEVTLTASWRGGYYWPSNSGVSTQSVTINNTTVGNFQYIVNDGASNPCIADTFDVVVSFAALPVTLASFTANFNKDKVDLTWETVQEINNKFFVEKSTDGITFDYLTKVVAVGNSNLINRYRFTDNAPYFGTNYYRLSQINIDGTIKYFDVKKIIYNDTKGFTSNVYNNGNGEVMLHLNSAIADLFSVKCINTEGKTVLQNSILVPAGGITKQILLPTGFYVLIVANKEGITQSHKIFLQ